MGHGRAVRRPSAQDRPDARIGMTGEMRRMRLVHRDDVRQRARSHIVVVVGGDAQAGWRLDEEGRMAHIGQADLLAAELRRQDTDRTLRDEFRTGLRLLRLDRHGQQEGKRDKRAQALEERHQGHRVCGHPDARIIRAGVSTHSRDGALPISRSASPDRALCGRGRVPCRCRYRHRGRWP